MGSLLNKHKHQLDGAHTDQRWDNLSSKKSDRVHKHCAYVKISELITVLQLKTIEGVRWCLAAVTKQKQKIASVGENVK